MKVAVYNALAH